MRDNSNRSDIFESPRPRSEALPYHELTIIECHSNCEVVEEAEKSGKISE